MVWRINSTSYMDSLSFWQQHFKSTLTTIGDSNI